MDHARHHAAPRSIPPCGLHALRAALSCAGHLLCRGMTGGGCMTVHVSRSPHGISSGVRWSAMGASDRTSSGLRDLSRISAFEGRTCPA